MRVCLKNGSEGEEKLFSVKLMQAKLERGKMIWLARNYAELFLEYGKEIRGSYRPTNGGSNKLDMHKRGLKVLESP